jgi:hypothetical protein
MAGEVAMVPILSLWLPIVLSAVFVFIVSSIIHMVLKVHNNELRRVPDEDGVLAALGKFNIPPGDYMLPRAADMKAMGSPAFVEKMKKGPVALMTVLPNGPTAMGKSLAMWFVYSLVVSVFAAYVAGRALGPGAEYLAVHRFAGVTAFIGYSLALWQNTIWYKRACKTTLLANVDGLIYGLVTGGTFGWLWPK